jgi:hypothetical protein
MDASEFEERVVAALLAGDDPQLATLRQQYSVASVRDREFTGVGFFTHFKLTAGPQAVEPESFVIDDVFLDVPETQNGASAMLFVRKGVIDCLEVVATTDDWPENPTLSRISYSKRKFPGSFEQLVLSEERDLEVTRRAWNKDKEDGS